MGRKVCRTWLRRRCDGLVFGCNGGGLLDDVAEALQEPPKIRGPAVVIEETPGGR